MPLKVGLTTRDPKLSQSCDGLAIFPPHRLSDQLRWRCSSCKSLVTTKETHFHLIECLRTFLVPMRKSVKRTTKSESDVIVDEDDTANGKSTSGPVIRPQTRVIRRPTPNIKHPVISESIEDKRGKSKNRIKSFHDRFLTHKPVGKARSLDPAPTIKIDYCKTVTVAKSSDHDGSRSLAKLTLTPTIINNNNNKSSNNRKKVSRTISQRNQVPELEPDPEWLEHLTKLKPCRKCKRTFFPERLIVHEPTCNAEPLKINSTFN